MYGLTGRVALVTGAGGEKGIGRAIAVRLAREGADVVVNDLADAARGTWGGLRAVAREIAGLGRRSLGLVGSVADADDVQRMVDAVVDRLGHLDILVNNAAASAGADRLPIVDLPESEWSRVHEVNAKGTYLMCRAGARHMIERGRGGRIVNIASLAGRVGIARYGAYCASKFAVVGLTQVLAHELGPHRITVNAICPGLVDTERVHGIAESLKPEGTSTGAYREELIRQSAAAAPLGRVARAEDVARTAAFLASDEAEYLTGQSVSVSGGAWMG